MENLRFTILLLLVALVINVSAAIGASLQDHHLTYERYMPSEAKSGHIRLMAEEAAENLIAHLFKPEITAKRRTPPLSLLLNYDIQKDGAPYNVEGKPLHFLVNYHYRKEGELPSYKPAIFTDEWVVEKVKPVAGSGNPDPKDLYIVCAAAVLNESNIVSLYILDRDGARLRRTLDLLKPIVALEDHIPPILPVDEGVVGTSSSPTEVSLSPEQLNQAMCMVVYLLATQYARLQSSGAAK